MDNQNQQYVMLDNDSAANGSIYDKLNGPEFNTETAKIAADAAVGTLDDNTDITAPDYDEAKTEAFEAALDDHDGGNAP